MAWLCRFKLHSVLVHSGGMHGGHYYSYSRAQDHRWLKFDDDKASAPWCWGLGCHQRLCARPLACPTPVTTRLCSRQSSADSHSGCSLARWMCSSSCAPATLR